MTAEEFVTLIREKGVTVGTTRTGWYANVLQHAPDEMVDCIQEKASDPVEAMEKLALAMGWAEEKVT